MTLASDLCGHAGSIERQVLAIEHYMLQHVKAFLAQPAGPEDAPRCPLCFGPVRRYEDRDPAFSHRSECPLDRLTSDARRIVNIALEERKKTEKDSP